MSATRNKLDADTERQFDIVYDYPFIDRDTIQIEIPEGYKPESIPKNIKIDNKFGLYVLEYTVKNNQVEVKRTYSRNDGRFPKTDYKDYVVFYNQIHKSDNSKLVFVKNEE